MSESTEEQASVSWHTVVGRIVGFLGNDDPEHDESDILVVRVERLNGNKADHDPPLYMLRWFCNDVFEVAEDGTVMQDAELKIGDLVTFDTTAQEQFKYEFKPE